MRPPFCEFCHHSDGSFNYHEWHAIEIGFFTPYFMWPFLVRHSTQAAILLSDEAPYVTGGMLAQFVLVLLPSILLLGVIL